MTSRKREASLAGLGDIPNGLAFIDETAPESSPAAKRSKRSKSHRSPKKRAGEENRLSLEAVDAEDWMPLSRSVSGLSKRFLNSVLAPTPTHKRSIDETEPTPDDNMAVKDPDNIIFDFESISDGVASATNEVQQIPGSSIPSPRPPTLEPMQEAEPDREILSSRKAAKELKGITKQLKKLNQRFEIHAGTVEKELELLKHNVTALELRQQRDEIRAAFRHEILFGALKKMSHDINRFELRDKARAGSVADEAASDSPKPGKKNKTGDQARKTMDHLLKGYTEDMNKAVTIDEVRKSGQLCIKYAEDLFKTYI
ncbi:hypothetical protein B0T19DRAFT_281516 [Cercophora scortea]|uniref:Uncharacterized protein n=1 Tax=Cercophora scortea TaxID=314031 RepID=A0AAE0I885_9PEZI|nr:hypothetical protein B0T19DRAFT_281516 [Cercophora scortea]